MLENVKRFDMLKEPKRQHLRPLIYAITLPNTWSHHTKIKKVNMDNIKPPYLLLCNHNAFYDFSVASKATFPHRVNYVVAIDGFIKREGLLRTVGGICKRKFTRDLVLIKHLKTVLERGDIACIYPEARYSLCGTTAILPESLGKMIKLFKVPVVTLICHGNHVNSPFWNLHNNKLKTEAEMTCLFNKDEIEKLDVSEINKRLNEAFIYDDFKRQRENHIRNKYKKRAEGLHKVLYQCPNCGTEYEMSSKGTILRCNHCNKEWELSEYGQLISKDGIDIFSHIPDWYEWERENVKREILNKTYYFESEVHIDSLPNAKGYINVGKGKLIHDLNGFKVIFYDQNNYELIIAADEQYGCHIEYEYLGKFGDCVDLNTINDTYYIYPQKEKFSVTKISLACEELFKYISQNKK